MGFLNNLFAQPTPEEAEGYNVATTRQMVCFGMEGFPAIVFSGLISTFYWQMPVYLLPERIRSSAPL